MNSCVLLASLKQLFFESWHLSSPMRWSRSADQIGCSRILWLSRSSDVGLQALSWSDIALGKGFWAVHLHWGRLLNLNVFPEHTSTRAMFGWLYKVVRFQTQRSRSQAQSYKYLESGVCDSFCGSLTWWWIQSWVLRLLLQTFGLHTAFWLLFCGIC